MLNEPTRTPEEHAKLKLARKLATLLIGGDPTAVPAVHPLRLPGSWHRKGKPKLCRIIATNEDAELDLDEALSRLEAAAKAAGLSLEKVKASSGSEDRDTAELIRLVTTGTEYLSPLVALSARYAGRGMSAKQIGQTLRGFMDAVPDAVRDMKDGKRVNGRWADRVANLGRMARSAVTKYGRRRCGRPRHLLSGPPTATVLQRTDIRLTPEHWNKMLGECAGILQTVLYMRGTVPVMLARAVEAGGKKAEDKDGAAVDLNGVRHRPGSLLFMEAVPGRVAWYLDEHATFWRYVRREKEWVAQHCPKEVGGQPRRCRHLPRLQALRRHRPRAASGRRQADHHDRLSRPHRADPGPARQAARRCPRRRTGRRHRKLWSGC